MLMQQQQQQQQKLELINKNNTTTSIKTTSYMIQMPNSKRKLNKPTRVELIAYNKMDEKQRRLSTTSTISTTSTTSSNTTNSTMSKSSSSSSSSSSPPPPPLEDDTSLVQNLTNKNSSNFNINSLIKKQQEHNKLEVAIEHDECDSSFIHKKKNYILYEQKQQQQQQHHHKKKKKRKQDVDQHKRKRKRNQQQQQQSSISPTSLHSNENDDDLEDDDDDDVDDDEDINVDVCKQVANDQELDEQENLLNISTNNKKYKLDLTLTKNRTPLIVQPTPPPASSSLSSSSRIFHFDAYCHLCKKEFCNKYFLRTHMSNKHQIDIDNVTHLQQQQLFAALEGITHYVDTKSSSHSSSSRPQSPQSPTNKFINNKINTNANGNFYQLSTNTGSTSDLLVEDYCELCNKQFCNKYYLKKHKLDVHGIQVDLTQAKSTTSLSTSSSNIKTRDETKVAKQAVTPFLPTSSTPLSHLQPNYQQLFASNNAGGGGGGVGCGTATTSTTNQNLFFNPALMHLDLLARFNPSNLNNSVKRDETDSQAELTATNTGNTSKKATVACDVCEKEFFNEDYLKLHKANKHGTTSEEQVTIKESIDNELPLNLSQQQQYDLFGNNAAMAVAAASACGITNPAIFGIMDSYFAAKMADRVTCDICNKQVCNKYFLKTHKLKVHGVIAHDSGESNGEANNQQQQNDDEMSDFNNLKANFLKFQQHLMDSCVLPPSPPPLAGCHSSTTHSTSVSNQKTSNGQTLKTSHQQTPNKPRPPALARVACYICKKELCNKYFLRSHLQNAHNITVDENFIPPPPPASSSSHLSSHSQRYSKKETTHSDNEQGSNSNSPENDNDSIMETASQQNQSQDEESQQKLQALNAFFNFSLNQSSTTNKNMQPFLIESHDDSFKSNFVPCMVYLPVKQKLNSLVSLKVTLKPLMNNEDFK